MNTSHGLSLLDEFSRLWSDGSRPSVEDFLAANPALAGDDEAVLGLIMAEVDYRAGAADKPSLDEYVRRFPALSDKLRRRWAYLRPDPEATGDPVAAPADESTRDGAPRRPAVLPDLPSLTLLREIGAGGMGVVWLARQEPFGRLVAVKWVKGGLAAPPEAVERFLREARAVGRLEHANIVRVLHWGEHDGTPYLVMEYLPGGSLSRRLKSGPLPAREAAELAAGIAEALGAAHAADVVHRDVKPGNVLLSADGSVRVADFGLARLADEETGMTSTGIILGTPAYMSPEQARADKKAGPPADVWSAGVVLYEMLAGRTPFAAATKTKTIDNVLNAAPAPLPAAVPERLAAICTKCLDKDARRRYANGADLAADLRAYLAGRPVEAMRDKARRRRRRWTAFAGGAACAVLAAYLTLRPDDDTLALRRGEAVELVRAGKPLRYEWAVGKEHATQTTSPDDHPQFGSSHSGMLLFRADPESDSYRFRLEFRHDRGNSTAVVGPLVGVSRAFGGPDRLQTGFVAIINDFKNENRVPDADGGSAVSKIRNDPLGRNLFRAGYFSDWGSTGNGDHPHFGVGRPVLGYEPTAGVAWRTVVVEVSPRTVVVRWEDRPDLQTVVPVAEIETGQAQYVGREFGRFKWPKAPTVRFDPRGGLGLYIRQSTVSVRRAVLEPTPSPKTPDPNGDR